MRETYLTVRTHPAADEVTLEWEADDRPEVLHLSREQAIALGRILIRLDQDRFHPAEELFH